MRGAQAVADGPPASRAPHTPCGSADLPQVHADRDRSARDDDVAAVVARRQSPRFIANKFARCREGLSPLTNLVGSRSCNAGLPKRQHRSRSQRRFPEDALVANVGCRRVSPIAPRPCEGPLIEPRAGAHHWPRERVLMPRSRPPQKEPESAESGGEPTFARMHPAGEDEP